MNQISKPNVGNVEVAMVILLTKNQLINHKKNYENNRLLQL